MTCLRNSKVEITEQNQFHIERQLQYNKLIVAMETINENIFVFIILLRSHVPC